MSAPIGGVHPLAVVGQAAEHRDHRARLVGDGHAGVFPRLLDGVIVHPAALLEAFVTVDAGIERPTRICSGVWLMKHVHVGHDAYIGPDCELAPGTVVGGHAVLERGVRCGIGVLILPFKRVGEGSRLGAGAVVTRDVPAGEVRIGNPAMPIERWKRRSALLEDIESFDAWADWWDGRSS